jgi:hypothetical protein
MFRSQITPSLWKDTSMAISYSSPRKSRLAWAVASLAAFAALSPAQTEVKFKSIPTQFLAALGEVTAGSGDNAEQWGLWREDPGPRGVRLRNFESLVANGGVAPAQWRFDQKDWWLEEHGLVMEQPVFSLAPGKYQVTGDRIVTTTLTIHPKDSNGKQKWQLADGNVLYDVTHLRCRSARYTPRVSGQACMPTNVLPDAFPVGQGDAMPMVGGCNKQDYAVLFIVGVEG